MQTLKHNLQILLVALVLSAVGFSAQAQAPAPAAADLDLGLGYEPQEIVDEWDEWYTNPTEENEFIADFMQQHNVPQTGLHGLTRLETWYWWASHHAYQVFAYINLRDQQNN
jgi:hypothetical protein